MIKFWHFVLNKGGGYTFNVWYRRPKAVSPTEQCKVNILLRDVSCNFMVTTPGFEPGTSRLLAQRVYHYTTRPYNGRIAGGWGLSPSLFCKSPSSLQFEPFWRSSQTHKP